MNAHRLSPGMCAQQGRAGAAARSTGASRLRRWSVVGGLMACAALASGCGGGGLDLVPVEGVVTLDGAPLADAGVLFAPSNPKHPAAMGMTDAEGRFSLVTANQAGAMPGEHRVAIAKSDAQYVQGQGRNFSFKVTHHVPEKYENFETSGLTAAVGEDENQLEFKLTSK